MVEGKSDRQEGKSDRQIQNELDLSLQNWHKNYPP